MRRLFKSAQEGFTLVELMVVVAIIGVLSAVAVPNFKKYQAKSKSSEAKLQLSAAYTALQSFYSDYDTYHSCLKYMGYNPSNESDQRFYATGFTVDPASGTHQIATTNGVDGTECPAATTADGALGAGRFSAAKKSGSVNAATVTSLATYFSTADAAAPCGLLRRETCVVETEFQIGALGIIDTQFDQFDAGTSSASAFTIDQRKRLFQRSSGY
jgi:type IV pilus assembly protein PilA